MPHNQAKSVLHIIHITYKWVVSYVIKKFDMQQNIQTIGVKSK